MINIAKTEPTLDKLIQEIDKLVYYQDEPFGSTSIFAGFSVMKLPRQFGVIVTLDGQGADEIVGGYNYYIPIFLRERISKPIEFLRELVEINRLNNDFKIIVRPFLASFISPFAEKVLSNGKTKFLFGKSEYFPSQGEERKVYNQLNKRLKVNVFEELQTLLRYADRNSMANSIEARVPYLDHRLVEFSLNIPSTYKIHSGWNKYISRRAFSNLMNKEIVWRKDKLGFPTPETNWFYDETFKEFSSEICNSSKLLKELNVIPRSYINSVQQLNLRWRIINLAIWEKVFNL